MQTYTMTSLEYSTVLIFAWWQNVKLLIQRHTCSRFLSFLFIQVAAFSIDSRISINFHQLRFRRHKHASQFDAWLFCNSTSFYRCAHRLKRNVWNALDEFCLCFGNMCRLHIFFIPLKASKISYQICSFHHPMPVMTSCPPSDHGLNLNNLGTNSKIY